MSLRQLVEDLVSDIPPGRVMTYGDIAACVGHPGAARFVGGIAHSGSDDVPWHRVVNRLGGLASGYGDGVRHQESVLADEGVTCQNDRVTNFAERRWLPEYQNLADQRKHRRATPANDIRLDPLG